MTLPDETTTLSLYETIASHARRNPDSEAVLAPNCHLLSYRRLSRQIDYVVYCLQRLSIDRADRVVLVLPNGPDMAVAFLGIAACVTCAPLNPSYGHDELEFCLSDLDAKVAVVPADRDLPARGVAGQLGLNLIELEPAPTHVAGDFRLPDAPDEAESKVEYGSDEDVALVLHTSGTTSRPKQVPLSHRNLCSSARYMSTALDLSPADRYLNLMPLFHIHGLVGVLMSSLFAGGSVVCSEGFRSNRFGDLMRDFEQTWYSVVPTIHQSVLELAKGNPAIAGSGHLRLIRSSSSSLPPRVMSDLEKVFRVPVIESYGMTEAAHQMSSNPLPPEVRKAGSVGVPADPEMGVMDDLGNLLSAGDAGEIVIRGANVMMGYVNNPQANEEAFTKGWFRTGDLGYRDDERYFYIPGRKKEMINRGGENVSRREIDEALLEHRAVAQAVAFAVPHASLGEDLFAAVVLHEQTATDENTLRRFAAGRLAPHKVPTRILSVESIPLGPTGKIQRIGLHKALEDQLRIEYLAPSNDLERANVVPIEQILQTSPVGATDNFFAHGGDSLKAASVLAQLSSQYQVEIPPVFLFYNPTPRELDLETTRLMGEDAAALEELLAEIEDMSDKQLRSELDKDPRVSVSCRSTHLKRRPWRASSFPCFKRG